MSVRKAFKSEPCSPGKKLTCENTAGELIDQLIGICFAQPPYLRKADAMRYVSLLNELRAFECIVPSPARQKQDASKQHFDTTFAVCAGAVGQFIFWKGTPPDDAGIRHGHRPTDRVPCRRLLPV